MSDMMTPIPFENLMNRLLSEHSHGTCFGVRKCYRADPDQYSIFLGRHLETLFGPAAGPNTQLAQNIIAAYYAGARFFELKTVQTIDGRQLAAAIQKPCISADDECYNCEWSTELEVSQARDEYIKAWFAIKVISCEWQLGSSSGFQFNISCGYDLAGIKGNKVNSFIDCMMHADQCSIYQECRSWLSANMSRFQHFNQHDLDAILPDIVNSVTVSTMHGCQPAEIEAIASYLLTEKKLNVMVKCNPTLLGFKEARRILNEMGYHYIQFPETHFQSDLQFQDAVPMLTRLQKLAKDNGLEFGVKISNTLPVDAVHHELPAQEIYMSGKSLYPLSLQVARNLSDAFHGTLRISFSGGCDVFNAADIVRIGIWPITVVSTLLKPGGYMRLSQIAQKLAEQMPVNWHGVDTPALEQLCQRIRFDRHYEKMPDFSIQKKAKTRVPLLNCFAAPCTVQCPIHQDVSAYSQLVTEGKYEKALEVILDKNPLPFMTGNLCNQQCQPACVRNQYEMPLQIRSNKLIAARKGFAGVVKKLCSSESIKKRIAIVGAGPAGIAAAFYLSRAGADVTVYDQNSFPGGTVAAMIPFFRISPIEIEHDVELAKSVGAKFVLGKNIEHLDTLRTENDAVILAIGLKGEVPLHLDNGNAVSIRDFLQKFNQEKGHFSLGENVVVAGHGLPAIDAARAAAHTDGVKNVYFLNDQTSSPLQHIKDDHLREARKEGILIVNDILPDRLENSILICHSAETQADQTNSRKKNVIEIPCNYFIASADTADGNEFYTTNGIKVNDCGLPVMNPNTNETSLKNVYAIGDCKSGLSDIIHAVADAKLTCETILHTKIGHKWLDDTCEEAIYAKKGILNDAPGNGAPDERCLSCGIICENCVDVCPNRANIAIQIPGSKMHQIVHIDYMCNECGNCKTFCPYPSAPYKDKLTLFATIQDMRNSKNDGFVFLTKQGDVSVRIGKQETSYHVGDKNSSVFPRFSEMIDTVYHDYPYLIL